MYNHHIKQSTLELMIMIHKVNNRNRDVIA